MIARRRTVLLVWLAMAALLCTAATAKSVHTSITAKWRQTPLLAEGAEALGRTLESNFWAALDTIAAKVPEATTQQQQYAAFFGSVVPEVLPGASKHTVGLLELELASRVYSPLVEMHRQRALNSFDFTKAIVADGRAQTADGCLADGAFAHFANAAEIVCDAARIRERAQLLVTSSCETNTTNVETAEVSAADHVHPSSAPQNDCPTVVLYGTIGQRMTSELHAELSSIAGSLRYVFRHAPSVATSEEWGAPVALQGYGVTLDVKNMEYKAVDDRKTSADGDASDKNPNAAAAGAASQQPVDAVVGGFDMDRLKQRKPALATQLSDFAEDLAAQISNKVDEPDMELKVWELQNLGVQAAYHVLSAQDRLGTLVDLLNNFPLRVAKVSRISVDVLQDVQASLRELQMQFGEASSAVYVNGRVLPTERSDLFSILEALRDEEAFAAKLGQVLLIDTAQGGNFHRSPTSRAALDASVNTIASCPVDGSARPSGGGAAPSSGSGSSAPKRFWIEQSHVTWLNDIQRDPQYRHLGPNIRDILRHNYYGQPLFPRRNVFHVVYVLDPSRRDSLRYIFTVMRMVEQGAPIRVGVVLVDTSAAAAHGKSKAKMTAAMDANGNVVTSSSDGANGDTPSLAAYASAVFEHLRATKSAAHGLEFLSALYGEGTPISPSFDELVSAARAAEITEEQLHKLVEQPGAIEKRLAVREYFENLGVTSAPLAFFNGIMFKENLDYAVNMGFNTEFPLVREWVRTNELLDSQDDIYQFIMENGDAMKRYQPLVFDSNVVKAWGTIEHAKLLASRTWMYSDKYEFEVPSISHVVVVDASTVAGIRAAHRAAEYFATCGSECRKSRVSFLFCSASLVDNGSLGVEMLSAMEATLTVVAELGEKKRAALFAKYLGLLLEHLRTDDDVRSPAALEPAFAKVIPALGDQYRGYFERIEKEAVDRASVDSSGFCRLIAQSTGGVVDAVHTNGRMTRLDDTFRTSDYSLLETHEKSRAVAAASCLEQVDFASVVSGIDTEGLTSEFYGNKLFQLLSLMGADADTRGPRVAAAMLPDKKKAYAFSVVGPTGSNGAGAAPSAGAQHEMLVVLDPVARESQRIVNIIKTLTTSLSIDVTICFNPPASLTKVPIKNFYAYVGSAKPTFDTHGRVAAPHALMRNMPTKVVLTMGLDEPEAWMVFASQAQYDLDNIKLSSMPRHALTMYAEFTLESILLTGSCIDTTTGSPPRGLPIVMSPRKGHAARSDGGTDTLVMSNYGYFQLQGGPGRWHVAIQGGRASDIFVLRSVRDSSSTPSTTSSSSSSSADAEEREAPPEAVDDHVVEISSFTGLHVDMRVQKRKGKEGESILVDSGAAATRGSDDSAAPAASGGSAKWPPIGSRPERPAKPTLNIFSVASGHLYERFLRLMMYTVMQSSRDKHGANTTRIKFWLIENFLSPQFKQLLPRLAAKFDFEYGLVTYRWPHWLRRQSEKQRTIWGYKILFLDVLFPLEVEKIIFVDADQIVRADLHELYNLDLQGNPVGYTPFCRKNMNPETKGFRFWDSGYWVDHLRGKPYHISAIYVVDLKRLRLLAAGDQYRMIYDNLSADPNSLANLDQDLPNFAQHQVPIFSLPEEWLWCETWCTNDAKERAKTIDLCNNPLTKTPKLENAKRIIPEWEQMDAMLSAIEREDA